MGCICLYVIKGDMIYSTGLEPNPVEPVITTVSPLTVTSNISSGIYILNISDLNTGEKITKKLVLSH